jgi:Flp pilus assembly protein TadG
MAFRASRRRRFSLGIAAVAAVEMGLIAPLLSTMVTMFVDIGKAYQQQTQIISAVSNGAEFAYLGAKNGTAPATIVSEITSEVVAASNSLLTSSNVSISVNDTPITAATTTAELTGYWADRCCLSGGAGSAVSWSCSSGATSCADGSNPGLYVTVTASKPFTPYFAADARLTGKNLVSSITSRIE